MGFLENSELVSIKRENRTFLGFDAFYDRNVLSTLDQSVDSPEKLDVGSIFAGEHVLFIKIFPGSRSIAVIQTA